MSSDKVIFHLARTWPVAGKPDIDPYEEFKAGRKTSEWRDVARHWLSRLCTPFIPHRRIGKYESLVIVVNGTEPQDITRFLKVHRAWLVVGYPKDSLPRLEADIVGLVHHPVSSQLEIKVANVREVLSFAQSYVQNKHRELGKILDQQRADRAALLYTTSRKFGK